MFLVIDISWITNNKQKKLGWLVEKSREMFWKKSGRYRALKLASVSEKKVYETKKLQLPKL